MVLALAARSPLFLVGLAVFSCTIFVVATISLYFYRRLFRILGPPACPQRRWHRDRADSLPPGRKRGIRLAESVPKDGRGVQRIDGGAHSHFDS